MDGDEHVVGVNAGYLVDGLRIAMVTHGDLPVDQYDNDTGTNVLTRTGFVTTGEHRDRRVIIIHNQGYDWDGGPSIPASQVIAELREAILRHGDLPTYQRDADTSELLPFDEQQFGVSREAILLIPDSYGSG